MLVKRRNCSKRFFGMKDHRVYLCADVRIIKKIETTKGIVLCGLVDVGREAAGRIGPQIVECHIGIRCALELLPPPPAFLLFPVRGAINDLSGDRPPVMATY
jgi:hypothetical protein